VLTPNYRLARRIKAEWNARQVADGAGAWRSVAVFPLDLWLQQQWEEAVESGRCAARIPLDSGPLLELWQQAIADEQRASGNYSLLQGESAAQLAQQARQTLLRWRVDIDLQAVRQRFELDEDCAAFRRWLLRFESRLAALDAATWDDCIHDLAGVANAMPRRRVALVDFDDIPPLFRACLEGLCEELLEIAPEGDRARCQAYAYPDQRSELAAVARWARQGSAASPGATIGIVLHDMAGQRPALEYLLRREFDCLGEQYASLPVNFSTGISLAQAPVVRDALRVLGFCRGTVSLSDILGVCNSRFLSLADADSALTVKWLHELHDTGRERFEVADLRYAAARVALGDERGLLLARCLQDVAALRALRTRALPSAWVARWCDVLDIWGWPGPGPLDSLEYQQVQLLYETLEAYAGYDAVCGALALDDALQLLERCARRQVSQPQSADSNIQVLGSLEAAGLAFDQLWLCGMQASSWPPAPRPNPFIPVALQRDREMPHATSEREWAFAHGLLEQYARATPQLHASYARHLDGVPELPSALLADFDWLPAPPGETINPDWRVTWAEREVERQADGRAPVLTGAGGAGGGASVLEDQSNCPFRAFARHRLAARPLGEPAAGVSAANRGAILHDALYVLFGEIPGSRALSALDDAARRGIVERAVGIALDKVPAVGIRRVDDGWRALERDRLCDLLLQWLAVEDSRSEFTVVAREQHVEVVLQGLRLSLRVDRVDQLADGETAIIDYKSGLSRVADWLGERPARPQLLLYGVAVPQPPAALCFAQVRNRDSRFVGLGTTEVAPGISTDIAAAARRMDAEDWDELNASWRSTLDSLARDFVGGDARVDALPGACTWCGLQPLCRVGHALVEAPE
jgi:probable DNA repair protein